jgi:hypothetical protein
MRLRISSIDPSVTKIVLQELFEEYGEVESVKIFRSLDGKTPTLGFIEMKRDRDAEAAIKALNGLELGDTPTALKVEYSSDRVTHSQRVAAPIVEDDDDDDDDDTFDDEIDKDEIEDELDEDIDDEEEEDEDRIKEIPLDELDEEI